MFKSRNFLMGLGIGFLMISLFMIFYGESDLNRQWSISDLKQLAKQNGYELYTQDELEEYASIQYDQGMNDCVTQGKENQEKISKEIYVSIPKGFDSFHVADYLFEVGVIDDKKRFLQFLNERKTATKIKAGVYQFDSEMSLEDVVNLITK